MLKSISDIIWGPATPLLFAVTGLYFIIKLRFFGMKSIKYIVKNTLGAFKSNSTTDGLKPFSAVATALGGTIGVGNTVGVASAVISGGAGAVVWMIVAAFFGMAIKYAEIFLSVKFKTQQGGGAMYYIKNGINSPFLAYVFCVVCIIASFGMGNMAQSNAVSQYAYRGFGTPEYISGILCAVITLIVISGGITFIGKVSSVIVPSMAVIYIILGVGIVIINRRNIPAAVIEILGSAFDFSAVGGGILGFFTSNALRYGFSRGLFSNEAGMGSSPTAHAASCENIPQKQAVWGVFEVFTDTVAVCGITALALVTCGIPSTNPADMVYDTFTQAYGKWGGIFLSTSIVFFALASIFCWYIYGQAALDFMYKSQALTVLYRIIFSCAVFMGAIINADAVWNISDISNGIMAFINLTAVVLLSEHVKRAE